MLVRPRQRGDTIVEVIFAVTVFSLVAVGGLSVMNQGTLIAQRSLEITLVRQEIDAQAELLRFINSAYIASYRAGSSTTTGPAAQWNVIKSKVGTSVSDFGLNEDETCVTGPPTRSFVINPRTAVLYPLVSGVGFTPETYSQIRFQGGGSSPVISSVQGLWIEAERGDDNSFVDFHIRACWDAPASRVPVTIGTIVRLYEP